jgi:hypothetical protein
MRWISADSHHLPTRNQLLHSLSSRQQLALHTAPLVCSAIRLRHVVRREERESAFEFGEHPPGIVARLSLPWASDRFIGLPDYLLRRRTTQLFHRAVAQLWER